MLSPSPTFPSIPQISSSLPHSLLPPAYTSDKAHFPTPADGATHSHHCPHPTPPSGKRGGKIRREIGAEVTTSAAKGGEGVASTADSRWIYSRTNGRRQLWRSTVCVQLQRVADLEVTVTPSCVLRPLVTNPPYLAVAPTTTSDL